MFALKIRACFEQNVMLADIKGALKTYLNLINSFVSLIWNEPEVR